MIREYVLKDRENLMILLKQGLASINQEDIDFCFCAENRFLVYESKENEILGFCSMGRWGEEKENGKIFLFVAPKYRRKGIGTILYTAIMEYVKELHLAMVETIFRADETGGTEFYQTYKYKKWYGLHVMRFCGNQQPVSTFQIIPYEDQYFEAYVEGMRRGFYEMRRVHDFRPYLCVEFSEDERKELLSDKENIFVLLVNGTFAASAAVHVNSTDVLGPVFVAQDQQGKGYGRLVTQFAINEALRRGKKDITLEVVEWNQKAVGLYRSLDFEIMQTMNSYRLFLQE